MALPTTTDIVSTKTVIAFLAGAALTSGAIGGATLLSPSTPRNDQVDFYAHAIRMERSSPDSGFKLTVYTTSIFTLLDGGLKRRDNGASVCDADDVADAGRILRRAMNRLDCGTTPPQWAQVVELRPVPQDDAGNYNVNAYIRDVDDGGNMLDLGERTCLTDAGIVLEVLSRLALKCADSALDTP